MRCLIFELNTVERIEPTWPELKAYQNEEREYVARYPSVNDWALSQFRLPRFLQTIMGFYARNVDLTGRHKPRFQSLMRRWKDFLDDIAVFPRDERSYAHVLAVVERANSGQSLGPPAIQQIDVVQDDFRWDEIPSDDYYVLERRWRIPTQREYLSKLCAAMDQLSDTLNRGHQPIFQELCLQDLPAELLFCILDFLDHTSARHLGATSRLFRNLSISYINRHRTFYLEALDWTKIADSSLQECRAATIATLNASKERVLEQMRFILGEPGLIKSMESLFVRGDYIKDEIGDEDIFGSRANRRAFYLPLLKDLNAVLLKAANVKTLKINNWDLPEHYINTILSMPALQTLDVEYCPIFRTVQAQTMPRILSPTILNARIACESAEDRHAWRFLPCLPNLRVFSVTCRPESEGISILPPAQVRTTANPFKTIERFLASHLIASEVDDLISWIQHARMTYGRLKLTHFKLVADVMGLMEEQIVTLLDVLAGSPLQSFCLDGVHLASPELIIRIATTFPRLALLSIQYRQSHRQQYTTCAYWPASSSAYAESLSRFPQLKHFIWNQRYDALDYPYDTLERMEAGWSDDFDNRTATKFHGLGAATSFSPYEDTYELDELEMDDPEPESSYDDWISVVKLFAVRCRSLKTVTFLSDAEPVAEYTIKRQVGVGIGESVHVAMATETDALDITELDPESSWPTLHTPAPPDHVELE
ncbi:hypothetical protein BXZ70DRAFT_338298 [Cristinia sonorae]|uniref:F-box domain-containing protein n=1 Tax=Cristinia sonorae TaxID=1940300 RepID=A0A8K0UKV1_9AGAR|nr:hypothetical protein BXZ70DRAFT_338298 [Cristinia sonorae]